MNYNIEISNLTKKYTDYNYNLSFGRASAGIICLAKYLIKNYKNPSIILPSTICVSPALIFFMNKITIHFVDVDKSTGLMKIDHAKKIISKKKISAVFFVNLYGNAIKLEKFYKYLKKKKYNFNSRFSTNILFR